MSRVRLLKQRLWRNALWAIAIVVVALGVGMVGYGMIGNMSWHQAFANAAMILSGMGPLDQLQGQWGHVFEGTYALVCGLLFLALAGFALAPALHHIMRDFHLEDEDVLPPPGP